MLPTSAGFEPATVSENNKEIPVSEDKSKKKSHSENKSIKIPLSDDKSIKKAKLVMKSQ